jgi:hypothetical protein
MNVEYIFGGVTWVGARAHFAREQITREVNLHSLKWYIFVAKITKNIYKFILFHRETKYYFSFWLPRLAFLNALSEYLNFNFSLRIMNSLSHTLSFAKTVIECWIHFVNFSFAPCKILLICWMSWLNCNLIAEREIRRSWRIDEYQGHDFCVFLSSSSSSIFVFQFNRFEVHFNYFTIVQVHYKFNSIAFNPSSYWF